MILPLTKLLLRLYDDQVRNSAPGALKNELSSSLLKNLLKRFERVEEIRILDQSAILHPRLKK